MRRIRWTDQATADLASTRAFIDQGSSHYASVVVARLIKAVDRLQDFPESGRVVPEFQDKAVREVVQRPYRIVYRLLGEREVHILTIHHSAHPFPDKL